jgi:6-phosphogluconolactonase
MPTIELAYVGSRTSVLRDGRGNGLEVFEILPDRRWLPHQTVGMDNPSFMVLSPNNTHLYVAHGDSNQISALELDPASGRIDYRDSVDAGGGEPGSSHGEPRQAIPARGEPQQRHRTVQ